MKTTRQLIELQQSGDDESKILVSLRTFTTIGETVRLKLYIESHLDGSFDVSRTLLAEYVVTYSGSEVIANPVVSGGGNPSGSPNWDIIGALSDLNLGGSGDVLVLGATYYSGGSSTVNWKIDYELTDYNA